jgi:hypothetical protein
MRPFAVRLRRQCRRVARHRTALQIQRIEKKHAADLEAEMLKRGMMFPVIDWHEGQGRLPFEH